MRGRRCCPSPSFGIGYILSAIGLGMLLSFIIPIYAMFIIVGLALIVIGIWLTVRCKK